MKNGSRILLMLFALCLFSLRADTNSSALEKLRQIPAAPANVAEMQSLKGPSLILTARGAFLNSSKTPIPFDQILNALASLPKEAWPYGRVIYYSRTPPGLTMDHAPSLQIMEKVESDLKEAKIQLIDIVSV